MLYSQGTVEEQPCLQQGCFLILWVLSSCPVWIPLRGRTEGLFEEDVNVGPVRGGIKGPSDLVFGALILSAGSCGTTLTVCHFCEG